MRNIEPKYKVWIELDQKAVRHNVSEFRKILKQETKLYSVVKSNAYGHGLVIFSKLADAAGVDGFCVDSVIEGVKLRDEGITKPILVLGYTLPALYETAADRGIIVTISNAEAFGAWTASERKPKFHIKIDTGMHRQGFQPDELEELIGRIKRQPFDFAQGENPSKGIFGGLFTHFAMAKDREDTAFTEQQFKKFEEARTMFKEGGFEGLMYHASASGGTLLGQKFHADMVRVGIGLYGLFPSEELERQAAGDIVLKPVSSLNAVVSEVKTVKMGEGVGYDLTERLHRDSRLAIVPIGYWHGMPRDASSKGFVHIGGASARIVGRVSMDMIVVEVTDIPCEVGSLVRIMPAELARAIGASPYEVITRLNPLIHKDVV